MTEQEKALEVMQNEVKATIDKSIEGLADSKTVEAIKEQLANATTKEDFNALKTSVEDVAVQLKAMSESNTIKNEKTDLIKFIERDKSSLKAGYESTVVKAADLMTTGNVIPNVANGFNQLFGNYIDPVIHHAPKQDTFIMSLVDTQVAPGSESIWYVETQNEEGDAEFIAEGALKPLIDREYIEKKTDVKEVAERWKMSKRLINHAPSVVADFRTHANELMSLKMDGGVLTGDGTGNNLSGITTLASPFIVPAQLANYYEDANIFDAIQSVATYVRLNNFKGELTCVLNTVWKAKMMGIKNADGDYIIPSFVTQDGNRVGEVRVMFENGISQDSILLGELMRFKVRISENVEYYEGYENDDFSKNLESRKLEAFLGTYLPANYAGAIIFDDIATVLTAIQAPTA